MTPDELDEIVNRLSREECGVVLGRLLARLLSVRDAQPQAHESDGAKQDRLLGIDEACAMLSCSKSYLYHRAAKLGIARKLGNGTVRYSLHAIQKLIKDPIRAQRLARRPE